MRTDLLKLSAAALAVLFAAPVRAQEAAATPAPAAVQPAVAQPTAAPSVTPRAEEGSQLSFNGYNVPRGKVVDGDVVVPFGDVRIEGEVTGDVTVGKGNLILANGALIRGDAVVNGGGQLFNQGGRVLGEMRVNSDE